MQEPIWFSHLPATGTGRRAVVIDNNIISDYLFRPPCKPEVQFLFESGRAQLQCGRQVIDEALNHPGLPVQQRTRAWDALRQLQARGLLVLSGTSQMTPQMMADYNSLASLLHDAKVSAADARVLADAIVKRIPLYTRDGGAKSALKSALQNPAVRAFLRDRGLPQQSEQILVG